MGANGAGKTTIIKMLCGLLAPSGGTIALAGRTERFARGRTAAAHRLHESEIHALRRSLDHREPALLRRRLRVAGRASATRASRGCSRCRDCAAARDCTPRRLPGGWKQRVAFGAAVMHDPEILFLDEPTSGVDPLARRQFWRLIDERARAGTAILVTTHYLEEAEHCHRLVFHGRGPDGGARFADRDQGGATRPALRDHDRCTGARRVVLEKRFPAWRVALFGTRLHLIALDDGDLERATGRRCARPGVNVAATRRSRSRSRTPSSARSSARKRHEPAAAFGCNASRSWSSFGATA